MSDKESPIKATLTVTLKAGDVAVAESHDPALWQQVLAAISSGGGLEAKLAATPSHEPNGKPGQTEGHQGSGALKHPAALAAELGVAAEKLTGAISPSEQSPYLHLDLHTWATWARNNPPRGPNSISPTALAATLLALWFRKAGLGHPTVEQAQAVLQTANLTGSNPLRSINNCRWLQLRGANQVVINPARIADCVEVARAFCSGEAPAFSG